MISIKRGDTLRLFIRLTDSDDNPIDIDVENIRSQIRDTAGNLIDEFKVEKTSELGQYKFTTEGTSEYPITTLESDIEFIINNTIKSSNTFMIKVIRDVTRCE